MPDSVDYIKKDKVYYDNKKLENVADGTLITNSDTTLNYTQAEVTTDYHGNKLLSNGTIDIEKIKCSYPIIIPPMQNNEIIEKCLKFAPVKYAGPDLGEVGNYCIAGHNYKNNLFFSKIKQLTVGDHIMITSVDGKYYSFKIYDIYTVQIDNLECLSQNTQGEQQLTLITCTDDNKARLIIKARRD